VPGEGNGADDGAPRWVPNISDTVICTSGISVIGLGTGWTGIQWTTRETVTRLGCSGRRNGCISGDAPRAWKTLGAWSTWKCRQW